MEEYFAEHAENYIENLGENLWLSKFEEKVLPEVSKMLDSFRNFGMIIIFYLFFFLLLR